MQPFGNPRLTGGGALPKLQRNRHLARIGAGQASQRSAGELVPAQGVGEQRFGLALSVRAVLRRAAVRAIGWQWRGRTQQAEQCFGKRLTAPVPTPAQMALPTVQRLGRHAALARRLATRDGVQAFDVPAPAAVVSAKPKAPRPLCAASQPGRCFGARANPWARLLHG